MKLAKILKDGVGYVRGNSQEGDTLSVDHLTDVEVENLVKAKRIKLIDYKAVDEAAELKAEVKALTKQVAELEKDKEALTKQVADLEAAKEKK